MITKLSKDKEDAINKVKNMEGEEFKNILIFISGMEAMKNLAKNEEQISYSKHKNNPHTQIGQSNT